MAKLAQNTGQHVATQRAPQNNQPTKKRKRSGRPSTYSPRIGDEICARIVEGRAMTSIASDADMPSYSTIFAWMRANPEFANNVALAREARTEAYVGHMLRLGEKVETDGTFDANRANAAVNAIDKAARLQMPKTRVEITGKDGEPLNSGPVDTEKLAVVLLGILNPAKAPPMRVIDHSPIDEKVGPGIENHGAETRITRQTETNDDKSPLNPE